MTRDRAATLLVAALAVVAISAAIGSVVAVWPGSHGLRSAAGSYAALADAALRGESPGHDQGRSFLTTYYFPPFPLVIAAAKRIGLGWLGALRLASLLSGLCLLIAAAWLARALGAGARGAWLACALVIACYPVKATLLDARADLLAAAFSLAALAAWSRDEEARGWSVPLLSAASLMIKATSFTLPVAFIAVWHWRRRSGLLVRFGGRFLIAIVVGIAVMVPFHGPAWYADSARALFLHSGGRSSFVRGPAELLRYLGSFGELAILGALAGAWLMRRDPGGDRPGAPITAFALLCVTYAIIVMMNFESGENHLVELSALLATLAAIWAAPRLTSAGALPAIAISIAVLGASWRDLETTLRHARTPQNLETRLSATLRAENGAV
ncbi:MAG TPA: hypothetical protein VL123_06310, partial [Candidatus Udaeobacter sp.]|nr:hypothetical protein [Candidatus Udaeobacter sp.]